MKRLLLLLAIGGYALTGAAQGTSPIPPAAGGGQPGGAPKPAAEIPGAAAPKGNARIRGSIVDSTTNQPVQFATVALTDPATNQPIDGVVSDEKGEFVLGKLAAGTYHVSITFIGFRTRTIPGVSVPAKGEVNLGRVLVSPDVTQLREITVTGEIDLVEDKVDRIVYNAEKDITNAGGNASDVLKKVPMLSVDLDGNVQLRGSSGVRVLINGKPSSMMAANVADALRQIPADMIKTVEVITSPSAKYDAEGTAGIINIITKKNNLQGVNGSVYSSAGNRSTNAGANVNFRRKKFGINASGGINYFNNPGDGTLSRINSFIEPAASGFDTISTYLDQANTFRNVGGGGHGQIGFDYDLTAKSSLNASLRLNQFRFNNLNTLHSELVDDAGRLLQYYNRNLDNRNRWGNLDLNLGYTKNFKEAGRELSFLGQHTVNRPQNNTLADQLGPEGELQRRELNWNNSRNAETTMQADYVHPFKNRNTFEMGAKGILREVGSDFQFSVLDPERGAFLTDPARSNVFNYDQDVVAGYATYAFNWQKISFKMGGRYEQTAIRANFQSSDTAFMQGYGNFIPSVTLSRDLTKSQKLRLAYTQRIQRPQIYFLNPFVNYSDTLNLFYGNPTLDPELTHSFELTYSTFAKSNSGNVSLYWRQTDNAIESVRTVDSLGVSRTTFRNIASNRMVGVSLFGSLQPTTKWRVSGNVNVYYSELTSPALNAANANWMYHLNLNSSYTFPKGFSAQFFGFFNSPRVQLQGRFGGFYNYNLAVKKELFKKKGSVSLGLDNPFTRAVRMKSFFQAPVTEASPGFVSNDLRNMYRRAVRLSFNYQFGKMDFEAKPRRKKSITNDDAKGGDGQQ
jgi:outer membrane receptor protein involved in Fe transport